MVLKYAIEGDTSYTTIFTYTTENGLTQTAELDASGNQLKEYREIQFRIELSGTGAGAGTPISITGLNYRYEVVPRRTT